jgi:hypothetical protein
LVDGWLQEQTWLKVYFQVKKPGKDGGSWAEVPVLLERTNLVQYVSGS